MSRPHWPFFRRDNYHENPSKPYWNAMCIPLTRGKHALISAEDFDKIKQRYWSAKPRKTSVKDDHYYAYGRQCIMHRVILGLEGSEYTDHINGNGLDNRRENLRVCTPAENARNAPKPSNGRISKYKGVGKLKGSQRWFARIKVNDKSIYCGSYPTEEEAAQAYNEAAIKYHGAFARLNEIEPTNNGERDND